MQFFFAWRNNGGCGNCCSTGWDFAPALDFCKNTGVAQVLGGRGSQEHPGNVTIG